MTRQEIERKIIDVARMIRCENKSENLHRIVGRMEILIEQLDELPKEEPK